MSASTRAARLALLLALSCAPTQRATPPSTPSGPTGKTSAAEDQGFSALMAALAKAPKAEPLADALPPDMKKAALGQIALLSPAQLAELRSGGRAAQMQPLFHVLAGGMSDELWLEVATRGRFTSDLMTIAGYAGVKDVEQLIPVSREVGRRAAAHWLERARARMKSARDAKPELLDSIDRAAAILDQRELSRRALELAALRESTADRWLRVAHARSSELDEAGARDALERARAAKSGSTSPERLLAAEKDVAAVADAKRGLAGTRDPEQAIAAARALVRLSRASDALTVVTPLAREAEQHAGLAATLASATASTFAAARCPLMEAGPELAQLCLQIMLSEHDLGVATERLRKAWQSGKGRDAASAETYVGLAHVMPFVSSMMGSASTDDAVDRIRDSAAGLEVALAEAKQVAPDLAGLHFYAQGLRLAFGKKDRDNLFKSPAERADFEAQAIEVAKRHGQHRLGQAGVLFAAAMLALDGNSQALVDALPAEVDPTLRTTKALLELWPALVERREDAARKGANELTQTLPPEAVDPVGRASLMLLMYEADLAMTDSPTALSSLAEASEKLSAVGWPPSLRLRALVDRAGTLARSGEPGRAIELLESIPEADAASAEDFARLAKAYALVLRGLSARGKERKPHRDALAKVGDTSVPRSFQLWRDMWVRELDFLAKLDACGKGEGCVKRAAKTRRFADEEVDKRVGRWLAALAREGVLSVGTFQAGLGYSTANGLSATVSFSFALPAVEYPVN